MGRSRSFWLALPVACLCLGGCGTLHRVTEFPEPPQVYGGVRTHYEYWPFGHLELAGLHPDPAFPASLGSTPVLSDLTWSSMAVWGTLDSIFSAVADTALLPLTLPTELLYEPEPEEGPD